MKINYIISDKTKQATSACVKKILIEAEKEPYSNILVLTPENKSIIIERELIENSKNKALLNVSVYSFVRLISRLAFVDPSTIISKPTCVIILRKIIYENIDKLVCYKKVAKTVGFAEKMYDTIQQFKSSEITFEDLKMLDFSKKNALNLKLKDIALIYEEYEKCLGDSLFDDCDKLAMLTKFAKNSEIIKNSKIFVVGFDNVTNEMVSVLKSFAANSKEITFSCVYFNPSRKDAYIQKNELYKKFTSIAEKLKYPYVPEFYPSKLNGDFKKIATSLFSNENVKKTPAKNVSIFEARTKNEEIDFVATKILNGIKSGKRFRDFGVFVLDEKDKELISNCFKSYKIPCFSESSYNISNHFFVKFLVDCFGLYSSHLRTENVLKFVSNPLYGDENLSVFCNFVLEYGINYDSFINEDYKKFSKDEKKVESVKNSFEKFKDFYLKFSILLKNACKTSDFVKVVDFVVRYFSVDESLQKIANEQRELKLDVESILTGQILQKTVEQQKSLISFFGNAKISIDEFLQIYLTLFDMLKINLLPLSVDTVVVQGDTNGFSNIKELFIVGAVEGAFPSKLQDAGIILDRELNETKLMLQKEIEPTVKQINERENFRIYEAVLEPEDKLYITYSKRSLDGAEKNPARIVLRLEELFESDILIKFYEKFGFVNYDNYEMKFASHINGYLRSADGFSHAMIEDDYSIMKNHLSDTFRFHLENFNQKKEPFSLIDTNGLYFSGGKTSVSQLEKYFSCPYLFFVTYGLRLKDSENSEISSLDVGNLIHRVAELFMQKITEFKGVSYEEFDKKVQVIFDDVVLEFNYNKAKNKSILKLVLDESKRLCKKMFQEQENSNFKVSKTEFSFSGKNAVFVELENGNIISIEGKIDRIDEFENYVRIVDYKTGDVKSELNSIFFGKKIQLVSYLLAVSKIEGKEVAGLFYFPVHNKFLKDEEATDSKMAGFILDDYSVVKNMDLTLSAEKKRSKFVPLVLKNSKNSDVEFEVSETKSVLSKKEFENLKIYTEKLCQGAINEILGGYIEPSPGMLNQNDSPCRYCKFFGVCGVEKSKFKDGRMLFGKIETGNFDLEDGGKNE